MKTFISRLCIVCLASAIPVAGSGQSLADAARKERERQKEAHSTATYTGIAATTAVTTSSTTTSTPVAKPFELKDNNGHDEKYWRKLFDQARSELKHAQDQVQLLQSKENGLNTTYLLRDDIYNKENRVGAEKTKNEKALDEAQKAVEQAQQKLSDLEDELHKAGGPAGWAR